MKHVLSLAAVLLLAAPVQSNPLKSVVKAARKALAEAQTVARKTGHVAKVAGSTAKDTAKGEFALVKAEVVAQFVILPALAKADFIDRLHK